MFVVAKGEAPKESFAELLGEDDGEDWDEAYRASVAQMHDVENVAPELAAAVFDAENLEMQLQRARYALKVSQQSTTMIMN